MARAGRATARRRHLHLCNEINGVYKNNRLFMRIVVYSGYISLLLLCYYFILYYFIPVLLSLLLLCLFGWAERRRGGGSGQGFVRFNYYVILIYIYIYIQLYSSFNYMKYDMYLL